MKRADFRGTVAAAAVLLDERRLHPFEVARRALALWQPGARVRRTRAGLVIVLARPRRLAVAEAPGLPLVARAGALVGFAAEDALLAALAAPAGSLVLRQGGQPIVVADGDEVSPADWLALGEVEVLTPRGLDVAKAAVLDPPAPRSVHDALGPNVPPPAAAREALLREAAGEKAGPGALEPWRRARAAGGGAGRGWLRRILDLFRITVRSQAGNGNGQAGSAVAAAPDEPRGPRAWLRRLASRARIWVGLHRILNRRHARYLAEMMAMLEGGEVREGLRHAIPLASMKNLVRRTRPPPLAWATLRARAQLAISPARTPSSSSLVLEDTLFERLQRLYRKTFERLDAQGRREEAAFVLAELLQQDEEAVAYLERHGELRRAAELAESRACAPGLVVRAWFLAGDRARAARLARERGAFHDAVVRLERGHPGEAWALRLLWADALASAGAYADAVIVAQHHPDARPLLLRWLEVGLALDEREAPRLTALEAAVAPERWRETLARAEAWLVGGDAPAAERRRALAEALPAVPGSDVTRLLARRCARLCLARAHDDGAPLDPDALRALVRCARDPALQTDVPPTAYAPPRNWRAERAPVRATVGRGGTANVCDAVVLPSGRLLVAHGEAGVSLLGRDGAPLHRFDAPAERLVISDAGDRAIALARRGGSFQLTRLDLGTRRATPWGLVELSQHADSYDGSVWFASHGQRLLAIDALADQARCFWSVDVGGDDGDRPMAIVRNPTELTVLAGGWGLERWTYQLPSLTLRKRTPLTIDVPPRDPNTDNPPPMGLGYWSSVDGTTFTVRLDFTTRELGIFSLGPGGSKQLWSPPLQFREGEEKISCTGATHAGLFALAQAIEADARVCLYDASLTALAELTIPGATYVHVRFAFRHLVIAAPDRPLTTLDLDSGAVRTVMV